MKPERMSDFFAARAEDYDRHMLCEVQGCAAGYVQMAKRLPDGIRTLLDLGCGTGLELEPIFKRFPQLTVTGIDLTAEMLQILSRKFSDKDLHLIRGDYLTCDYGGLYDAAVSFQTMHHFSYETKEKLYRRIYDAVKLGGVYLECDYMLTDPAEETKLLNDRPRTMAGELYHYDIPFTVDHQMLLLKGAGFSEVEPVFWEGNTTMLFCRKSDIRERNGKETFAK